MIPSAQLSVVSQMDLITGFSSYLAMIHSSSGGWLWQSNPCTTREQAKQFAHDWAREHNVTLTES